MLARTWDVFSLPISECEVVGVLLESEDGKLTRDRADFLAGQYFDIRVEVHAPVNGSEGQFSPGSSIVDPS